MPVILPGPAVLNGTEPMPAMANDPVQIGDWLVDPRDDSLARGSERVKIEPRTMRLLMRLAQSPGTVISQEELLESVWSGLVVGTASIYQSMSQLRKVLGDTDDPPRYIETVARKGYRLVAPVSVARLAARPVSSAAEFAVAPSPAEKTSEKAEPHNLGWVAIAAASAIAVMAAVWRFAPQYPVEPLMASIVVLPFTDLTNGKTEQAFCDGLTEETSNWLAQIPTLRVVARTSAFSYRGGTDVRKIGRELNISHVLEGSLRRSGNRMRITVQLIDSRSGYHLWSGNYNVEAGDVLNVQEEVARAVAGNLELRMTPEVDQRFAGRRSANSEAQRLYLIARSHAAKLDGPSNEQAIQLYRQAIEADPGFALAKVWLARSLVNRRYFDNQPIEKLAPEIQRLLAEVEKATPQLVDLYIVRGGFQIELRNREPALGDMRRALSMSPNSLGAASMLGLLLPDRRRAARCADLLHDGVGPGSARLRHACVSLHGIGRPGAVRRRDVRLRARPRARTRIALGVQRVDHAGVDARPPGGSAALERPGARARPLCHREPGRARAAAVEFRPARRRRRRI